MNLNQKQRIALHLASHKSLTPLEALNLYGCFRLASVVHTLKADGMDIVTNLITTTNSDGESKTYAQYHLRSQV